MTRAGVAAIAVLSISMAGCAATTSVPSLTVDRATCEREAVLLTKDTSVLAAPSASAVVIRELSKGDAGVYRCAAIGSFRGIEFPAPAEPTDCSSRRDKADSCPTGWVLQPLDVDIAG